MTGSSSRPKRALSLAHDHKSTSNLVGDDLRRRGYEVLEHVVCPDVNRPSQSVPFPDHREFDLILPMGSAWSVYDSEMIPWIDDELELIRSAHAAGTPVIGICFGGQALAAALGGKVEESPVTEIGWYEIEGERNPIGSGPWMQWHHDRFEAPPDADVLAWTEVGPQLFTIGQSIGTQFHPEVTGDHLVGWLNDAPTEYREKYNIDGDAVVAEVRRREAFNAVQCERFVDWALDFAAAG